MIEESGQISQQTGVLFNYTMHHARLGSKATHPKRSTLSDDASPQSTPLQIYFFFTKYECLMIYHAIMHNIVPIFTSNTSE